ncbi:MAG TPA: hypothetical protein VF875_04620 [Anaeromyxobacter sp.]
MRKRPLPELPDTGRRYVENTVRARLASPGVERYAGAKRGSSARLFLAAIGLAALVAAMLWFAR